MPSRQAERGATLRDSRNLPKALDELARVAVPKDKFPELLRIGRRRGERGVEIRLRSDPRTEHGRKGHERDSES